MLEYSLIKQHQPRFNVRLRDDKSYPFLAVTVDEQWPRALVMRGRKRKGTRYFGPVRPRLRHPRHARRAAAVVPDPHVQPGQVPPARAARPAVPAVPHREVQRARASARSTRSPTASSSTSCATSSTATPTRSSSASTPRCGAAATELEFEKAARVRDRLAAVRRAIERQQMVAERSEDLDVIGLAEDELEASRPGVLRPPGAGRRPQGVRRRQGRGADARRPDRPHPRAPVRRGPAAGRAQAGARAGRCPTTSRPTRSGWRMQRGSRVQIRVPQRGDKRALLETVTRNAQEEFTRHRLRRASDHNTRSRALTELQELPRTCPRRRCASSATTWPTSRAPTTSARWSCSRTGSRTSASTAGSRSTCRATTTTRRWRRCSPAG